MINASKLKSVLSSMMFDIYPEHVNIVDRSKQIKLTKLRKRFKGDLDTYAYIPEQKADGGDAVRN